MVDIDVALDDLATPTEIRAVEDAFRAAGFDVRAQAVMGRRGVGDLPWLVHVTLGAPIAAFFASFAAEGGKDAYAAVKQWARSLSDARTGAGNGTGSVVLTDPDASNLVLSSDIPEQALEALRELDWDAQRGDYLVWDRSRATWRDPTKRE